MKMEMQKEGWCEYVIKVTDGVLLYCAQAIASTDAGHQAQLERNLKEPENQGN